MPISTKTSQTSVAAAPSSRCARRFTPRPAREREAAMNHIAQVDRRAFVLGMAAVGGGAAFGFDLPFGGPELARAGDGASEINAWVVIRPDDTVIVRVARSEMGQGTLTGLAQLVAEELECDWSKVTWEYPTPGQSVARKRPWGDFSTAGSRGIRMSHEYVRKGGATAREMLIQAAAKEWNVPASECSVSSGVITHKPSGRTTTYGKVAEAAAKLEPPADVKLKDPKDWKIAGKPLKRLDTPDKVTGKQVYGFDLKFPGMVNAAVKECPVFGGKVKSFDAAKVSGMPGVQKVVQVGNSGVAVVADTWWHAKTALDQLPIEWDEGENAEVSSATIADWLKEGLDAEQAFIGNQNGDAKAAITGAAKKVEAVYAYPFQNHATMEPMNATARYTPEKCEVWVPTQDGEASFAAVLAASGLPADKCEVYKLHLCGGFGRRTSFQDYVHQAVQFDKDNNLTGLHMRLSGQSILASVRPAIVEQQKGRDPLVFQGVADSGEHAFSYTVPNLLIDHSMRNPHVPPGFWRGVNINQNAIFIECFMDELAQAAGQDELEFRRKLMSKHPRNLGVLNAVAEKVGWGKPAPQGVFRGLALMKAFNAYVAAAAEISVEDGGNKVKIHRLVAATDPGYIVNPAQVDRQVAGSFVYGLSGVFMQECTVKNGRIEQGNFDSYDSMRIAQMPKVESIQMPTGASEPWGGVGEPTICVAAPAVLNAYFKATGKRIRSFPLKNHNITLV